MQLTSPWKGDASLMHDLESLSNSLGWYPNDIIEEKNLYNFTTGHIFVEHGLDNSAVISFINKNFLFNSLSNQEHRELFNLSYNNLVDLHIAVDNKKIFGFHNRLKSNNLLHTGIIEEYETSLNSNLYSRILDEKRIKPSYPSIDDALINTISYWKRLISTELENKVSNEQFSFFFNSLIFTRAIEDYYKKDEFIHLNVENSLLEIIAKSNDSNFLTILKFFYQHNQIPNLPQNIIDFDSLEVFNKLNHQTIKSIINDFYYNKQAPYDYDFSIMSKHALSRLYEKYVTILQVEDSQQLSFFTPVPDEFINKNTGSYYTPQFIARFFTRFIETLVPHFKDKNLNILEPAVGSGIFIRTILEREIEKINKREKEIISERFYNFTAIDNDPTACNAANLSLTLLYLVSVGSFPEKKFDIISNDALELFLSTKYYNKFEIVISNPPFVKYNSLPEEVRSKLKIFLSSFFYGKPDLYLAFLKIGLNALKIGGYGLFVLPNTFLITDSAKKIRKYLSDYCLILSIIDLSDNRYNIFEDVGVYPILLIFKKKGLGKKTSDIINHENVNAIIASIQDYIGKGLHYVLKRETIETTNFSVYEVKQSYFKDDMWYLLPPTAMLLKTKLACFKRIDDYFYVRTGFSSGAGEIFLRSKKEIPVGEESIYISYINDREMESYSIPSKIEKFLFYPFVNNHTISEQHIKNNFPKTYAYLKKYEKTLKQRSEVISQKIPWWMPNRPRKPKFMLIPKIITPHMVFTPKFSVDYHGKFAVSRSPYLVLKEDNIDQELLYFFTAVLNSSVCFWYLLTHSPKYQHGYAMLEPKHLSFLPLPDPYSINKSKVFNIISKVKQRISNQRHDHLQLDQELDSLVSDLYNLTNTEKKFLNIL